MPTSSLHFILICADIEATIYWGRCGRRISEESNTTNGDLIAYSAWFAGVKILLILSTIINDNY
jgi:hypothetical protein